MVGIVIASHGVFCEGLKSSTEMIGGTIAQCTAVALPVSYTHLLQFFHYFLQLQYFAYYCIAVDSSTSQQIDCTLCCMWIDKACFNSKFFLKSTVLIKSSRLLRVTQPKQDVYKRQKQDRCALKHCKAIVMVIKKLAESNTRMPRKISIRQSGHTAGF